MGAELGQWREWNHDRGLDWHLLDDPMHAALRRFVQDLNWHYHAEPALYQCDFKPEGFRWIDCHDNENSVVSIVRYAHNRDDFVVMVFNFTPVVRAGYRIGVPTVAFAELLQQRQLALRREQRRQRRTRRQRADHRARVRTVAHTHGPPLACLLLKKR
jgi:1,4-alpha-glucan branching enzyme